MKRLATLLLFLTVLVPAYSRTVVWRRVQGVGLRALINRPNSRYSPPYPAAILFHGGGWAHGVPEVQNDIWWAFRNQGYLAIAIEYRVWDFHRATPLDSVHDATEAIRWVRANALELGIDPNRIVAYGESAGGHLAAMAALSDKMEDPDTQYPGISYRPNAVIVRSGVLMTAPGEGIGWGGLVGSCPYMDRLVGLDHVYLSPLTYVRPDSPPFLVFHGAQDGCVPVETARAFVEAMRRAGADITYVEYPDWGHKYGQKRGDPSFDVVKKSIFSWLRRPNLLGPVPTPVLSRGRSATTWGRLKTSFGEHTRS